MEKKITVGQVLYKEQEKRGTLTGVIEEKTVTKVGRVYFYCDNNNDIPYSIEDLRHRDKGYSPNDHSLYVSKQDIADKTEERMLRLFMREYFAYGKTSALTLDQLRQIHNIINQK